MPVVPRCGPVMLLMALGLLSTSCGAARSVQTIDGPTSASPAVVDGKAARRTADVTSVAPSMHITYRPEWLAGKLLTLDGAQAQVRRFLGEPTAVLKGHFVDEAAPGMGSSGIPIVSFSNRKLFMIERQVAGARYPDSFTVDASSGEVIEAIMPSNKMWSGSSSVMSDTLAIATAEAFARTRFAGFDRLTFKGTDPGVAAAGDPLYIVRWQQQSPNSGAWLPTSVDVGIDRTNRRVVSYSIGRTDYRGPTTPKISRERAVELALVETKKDARLANVTVDQVELVVAGPDQLAWFVALGNVPRDIFVRHFYVDALTGAILNPLGSPVG